jgi:hypothetical protein
VLEKHGKEERDKEGTKLMEKIRRIKSRILRKEAKSIKKVWDVESGGTERQAHKSIVNVYCC